MKTKEKYLILILFLIFQACKKKNNELPQTSNTAIDTLVYDALNLRSTSNFPNALNHSEQIKKPILLAFYAYGNQNPLSSIQKSGLKYLTVPKIKALVKEKFILVTLPVDDNEKISDHKVKVKLLAKYFDNLNPKLKDKMFHPNRIRSNGNFNQSLQLALCRKNTYVSYMILNGDQVYCLKSGEQDKDFSKHFYEELTKITKQNSNNNSIQ